MVSGVFITAERLKKIVFKENIRLVSQADVFFVLFCDTLSKDKVPKCGRTISSNCWRHDIVTHVWYW